MNQSTLTSTCEKRAVNCSFSAKSASEVADEMGTVDQTDRQNLDLTHDETEEMAQNVNSIFQKLHAEGEERQEGILGLNKLSERFCELLVGKNPHKQAELLFHIDSMVIQPVMAKANIVRVVSAIVIGRMGNKLKSEIPHGEWTSFCMKYFPGQSMRAMQENMRIGNVRKIENHCDKELTLLKKLCQLAEKHPFKNADDPIEEIFKYVQSKCTAFEADYTVLAGVAIADNKLKKAGIDISISSLRDFYEQKFEINGADIREMQGMKKEGLPLEPYLEEIIKNAGSRVYRFTKPKMKKEELVDPVKIVPDINSAFVKTYEIIAAAIKSGKASCENVNREICETLLNSLQEFKNVVFPEA